MLKPALQYLVLRSLGAPAVLLSLAMQGVFRGLKDTKTPLYATGIRVFYLFGQYYLCSLSFHFSFRTITWPCLYLTLISFCSKTYSDYNHIVIVFFLFNQCDFYVIYLDVCIYICCHSFKWLNVRFEKLHVKENGVSK